MRRWTSQGETNAVVDSTWIKTRSCDKVESEDNRIRDTKSHNRDISESWIRSPFADITPINWVFQYLFYVFVTEFVITNNWLKSGSCNSSCVEISVKEGKWRTQMSLVTNSETIFFSTNWSFLLYLSIRAGTLSKFPKSFLGFSGYVIFIYWQFFKKEECGTKVHFMVDSNLSFNLNYYSTTTWLLRYNDLEFM